MLLTATVTCVLLCLVHLLSGQSTCHKDAPNTCDFSAGNCNWSPDDGWFEDSYLENRCMKSIRDRTRGSISSRTACSTEGEAHCFKFKYHFTQDNVLTLSVLINETNGDGSKLLWQRSSRPDHSDNWVEAAVSVETNGHFTVMIECRRMGDDKVNSVYVADLVYLNSSCTRSPATTKPPPVPTATTSVRPVPVSIPTRPTKTPQSVHTTTTMTMTTSTNVHTATTPTATPTTVHPPIPPTTTSPSVPTNTLSTAGSLVVDGSSTPPSSTKIATTTHTEASATTNNTPPDTVFSEFEDKQSKVGLFVGIAVAVVCVIAIVVVIVIFVRRRRESPRGCDTNTKQANEIQTTEPRSSTPSDDPTDIDKVYVSGRTRRDSGYENHLLDDQTHTISTVTASRAAEDVSRDSAEHVYSTVNKPRKVNGHQSNMPDNFDDDPYEIKTEKEPSQSAISDEYSRLSKIKRSGHGQRAMKLDSPLSSTDTEYNHLSSAASSTDSQQQASEYDAPKGETTTQQSFGSLVAAQSSARNNIPRRDGGYNSLDFGGNTSAEKLPCANEGDAVYNHLNEGNANAYNEVGRERRDIVIDGEYSHIK